MELNLEVVLSSSIKRKKPWPQFCWLGQEKESIFLLDDKRISEINLVSGRTKKRTPKLHPLLNNVVTMRSSTNGMWLCGLLKSGEMFLWNRDKDLMKTTTAVPEVADFLSCVQGNATRLYLQVSGDGMRVLLVAVTGEVFLWQCADVRDFMVVRDCTVKGNWTQIEPSDDTMLPKSQDKEACVHTLFVQTEALGDSCLSAFMFTSGNKLIISWLHINWGENQENVSLLSYNVKWATKSLPLSGLKPPCQSVKSRGAIVAALSPDGQLLAIVINQRKPHGTQVIFISTVNFVSVSRNLGGCGCKNVEIPSKYSRSYWVASVSWSPDGILLACVLKRGSLLMLPRLGGLLSLSTSGCNIDFGPAHFLPLHPLVTYRPPSSAGNEEASLTSSSLSIRDVLRQRYSVTWHPQLFYFIVSDGYMATVVRVLEKVSPDLLFKMLLKDTTLDLEKARQLIEKSQKNAEVWLDSVSALNLEKSLSELHSAYSHNPADTIPDGSTKPLFLQDQKTIGTPRDLLETVQTFFEDDSDLDGVPVGSHVEDGGHLEFASMFDTLHALNAHYEPFLDSDSDEGSTMGKKMARDMEKLQTKMLTTWAFGMSMRNSIESRSTLWKHCVKCVLRFIALSQLTSNSTVQLEKASLFTVDFLKKLLSFIPWERANSQEPHSLGIMVQLCKNLVQLVLSPFSETYRTGICEISSHNLSTALQIIEMVSQSLDHTYSLQHTSIWSPVQEYSQPLQHCPLDLHKVPLLQDETKEETYVRDWAQPSKRLHHVWRLMYTISNKYLEELHKLEGCNNSEREKQQLMVIMCKIQRALQSSGERLEEANTLLNYSGEHLFLSGLYTESSEVLFSQLMETSAKSGKSTVFKKKRLCLALLYSLLSQYRLKEAQELGDHMASLILKKKRCQSDDRSDDVTSREESVLCLWLSKNLDLDTAYAVVQTLGRFMASYFSNQTLYILPPHSVDVLPPIHLPEVSNLRRLVPLCQKEVTKAVRQQQLSEIWTVEYALDLLLLGGLLPESVWLAYHLGDWKAAISLSLAYSCFCIQHFDFTSVHKKELHLPKDLGAANILQTELKSVFSSNKNLSECGDIDADQTVTDPVDEDERGLLQVSIRDILKASVMAGVDVVSSPLSSLVEKAKDLCSSLTAMVPAALYLPSPPLYCPQPSPNSQDPAGTSGYHTEMISRHKISQVIQRLLLLLRSAHCCSSAAQWYLSQLRRARHILYKMKKKYSYPNADVEEKAFPDGLMKFINRSGHFRSKTDMDPSTVQTLVCFRELCALCWMLHVRDQLSATCRKYQAEKQQSSNDQIPEDSAERSSCVDALQWAQRLLPFSQFLNCEDILQDTLLSLLSEMPPVSLVADTIVLSFPEEEESIRVSLREKYNTLIQTLRQCNVTDGKESGEMMMVLIQDKLRLRKKHFARLRRHLVSLELHLWGKDNENEDYRSKHGMAMLRQLSMGTSLSTSSITDYGLLPLHSDAETTENTSEAAVSSGLQNRSMSRSKTSKIRDRGHKMKAAHRVDHVDAANKTNIKQPALLSVGSWEFELEDEEYLNFLELFLSYLLEKDTAECPGELPLLKGFSNKLREKELHSLTFDVLTTMHRCQRDGHHPDKKNSEPPVFRAGSCFRPMTQDTAQISSSFFSLQNTTSLPSSPQLEMSRNKGLFSHQNRQRKCSQQSLKSANNHSVTSSFRSDLAVQKSSPCLRCCSVSPVVETKQGIDSELEGHFPGLARLLEWMMRWADRRLMLGHLGKKRDKGSDAGQMVDGGVVIRVKASTPAVLTSLSLMAQRYTTLPGADDFNTAHLQIPETQRIVAPAVGRPTERKVERQSCVDKGFMSSTNTTTTVESSNLQQKEDSLRSCTVEPERQSLDRSHLIQDQDAPQSETELRAESYADMSRVREPSPSIPSEICSPDTSLKLADLESSQSQHISDSLLSLTSPDVEPLKCSSSKPEIVSHNVGSNAESLSQTAEVQHIPPPAADPCTVSFAPDQVPPVQASPMRQRLGEDLYRLVQNINYMSLMEVLGASFSNLQLAQQNASLAQSNLNTHVEVPVLNVHNVMPSPNAPLVTAPLVTHAQRLHPNSPSDCVNQTATATQHRLNMNLQTGAFSSTPILSGHQEMTPLFVQAGSPVRNMRYNLIPVSEGLLTTTEAKQADHRNSGLPASNSSIPNHPAQLKLLQLRPPQLSTFVPRPAARSYPSHESMPSRCKLIEQPGYAQNAINSASVTQHQPAPVSSNLNQEMCGRLKKKGFSIFPQTLPVPDTSTPQGLRLLQVHPVSSSNTTFPKLPTKTFSRPSTSMFMPIEETPQIKLLQIDHQPKMKLPLQASLSKIAHPIPEKLSSAAAKKQNDVNTEVQLLTVEKPVDYSNKSTPLQNSRKRQRRREKAGKAEVSFRPNDSIIPQEATSDAEDVPVSEEVIHELDSAMPCGPFSAQGESLVAKAFATAAELHAFASTSKRPPEQHDVFTNTDADSSLHVDKAVSTDNSTKTPLWRKEEAFRNDSVQDQKELQLKEDRNVILEGRQFISVVDLEDKSQHQDLPQTTNLPSVCAEPTVAELHIMATTVLRNDADLQASFEQMDNMCNDQTSAHSEESVSLGHLVSDGDLAANIGDFEAGICGAVKTQALSNSSLSQQPTAWFSSQMSQLDSQLAALQRIADSLETDFSKARMLVNVPVTPTPVSTSDKTRSTGVKKTVRLHVPPEINGRTPQDAVSKDERTHESVTTSTAGLTGSHPPPRRTLDLAELSAISNNLGDVNQEEAGLSDTVDILEELVREGFLSQTDLDLSTSSARQQQRPTQESKRNMSQSNAVPEEDRRELRIWMRKKQRETHAVYQKHRKNLREREHRPFSSPCTKSVNKNPRLKAKVDHNQVLDNFNQRTLDACNLASDLSACALAIKGFSDSTETFTPRSFSALPPDRTYRVCDSSVRDRFPSGLLRPHSAGSKEVPSESYRQRLGIDRPVTSLPRDRLSQVTRRGMVTNTTALKSNTRENIESKGSPSRSTAVAKMNKLVKASKTFRICGGEESSLGVAELDEGLGEQNDARAGEPQWDWLDNLSETGSSNLSKIDWAAIERMVSEDT